jgi:zinc protease
MRASCLFVAAVLLLVTGLPARAVEVQQVTSPGGITAWLVEDHSNPILSLDLAFVGGASLDPEGQEGLAYLVSGLIDEGAGELDSQAFQAKLQNLAIGLSFDAGLETFQGSLRTLTENRETAFELLRLALSQPRFDDEPVARIRSQVQVQLAQDSENPNVIASRALRELMFPGHPYSRPVRGTPETVDAIGVEDMRRFVSERFALDVLKIAVVGDVTAEELGPLLDHAFLGLPSEAAPNEVPEVEPQGKGQVMVIERDIPQSVILFAQGGLKRQDPDFYAAYVANHVLGAGTFSSRLYEEVREKRGLAYSVYSYLNPMEHSALIQGGVATANEHAGETLAVIRDEWARMGAEGPTAEEVGDAKTYLTGSYPLRFSSTGDIAGTLLGIQLDDLGIDYINIRNDLVDAVTAEDAQRVARALYRPEDLTVVIVGRPAGVATEKATAGDNG